MILDETIARLESKNVSETERLRAALEARPQVFIGVNESQIVQLGAGGTDRDRWMAFLAEFGIAPHRGMEAGVLYWRIGEAVVKLEFDEAEKFTGVSTVE